MSVPYPLPRQQVHGEPSKYRDGLQRLDVVLDDKGQRSHRVVAHPFGVRKFTPARRAYGTAPLRTTEREPEPRSPTWPGGAECGFVAVLGTVRSKFGGALDAACRAAPVRTFTPHAIRYAVVRRYRKAGVDVATAADIFGHSIAVMLGIYNAIDPVDRADALALVSKFEAGEPKRAAGTVLRLKR